MQNMFYSQVQRIMWMQQSHVCILDKVEFSLDLENIYKNT